MRAATLVGVLLLTAVAGCAGSGPGGKPGGNQAPTETKPPTNVAEFLRILPQFKVLGPTTVDISSANGTKERPEVVSFLVWMSQKFKTSNPGHAGGPPVLFAMIAHDAVETANACAPFPKGVKAYFRARDGTSGNGRFNNISGEYDAGYYHMVMVADAAASFTITFGSDDDVKPRKHPARNVYANASGLSKAGVREYTEALSPGSGTWFAWANHRIGGTNLQTVDGGRTHIVSVGGDCAKAGGAETSLTIMNQGRSKSATARGASGGVEAIGKYQPQQGAAAPTDTSFEVAWVWIQPITLPDYYQVAPSPS